MNDPDQGAQETAAKLAQVRLWLEASAADAVRLRGSDWFAWITAGGSNVVLQTAETGVAEVLVTRRGAWVLCDEIDAGRIADEEVGPGWQIAVFPWASPEQGEGWVHEAAGGGIVLSDRPGAGERPLPAGAWLQRCVLGRHEQARYRALGRDAAAAMEEALLSAQPGWTELQLAAVASAALVRLGICPALVLAAGAQRLLRYRHPVPGTAPLGARAMLVFCARRHGLYANLTRCIAFGSAPPREAELLAIEAAGLNACVVGAPLSGVYRALAEAYQVHGVPKAILAHHQGGITGYRARELLATPDSAAVLAPGMALALNPSLPGLKLEDSFLLGADGLENLTLAPGWPVQTVQGRARPLWWVQP